MLPVVLASLLTGFLPPAATDPGGSPEKLLATAYHLSTSQDLLGALASYRQAARLAREQRTLWQEIEACTRLLRLQPDNPLWREHLRQGWETDFPRYLSNSALQACPLPLTEVSLAFRDTRLESGFQGRRYGCYIRPKRLPTKIFSDPSRVIDPRRRGRFNRVMGGYVFEPEKRLYGTIEGVWERRFRVFYPSLEGRDYTALAEQILAALLKFYWIAREYLGRSPQFVAERGWRSDAPLDVWLCEGGEGAGEQWHHHLYLYQTDIPRAGSEWLRELAHEYGHHVLPPYGREWSGTRHETWLNGELGEHLFLRWLGANLPPEPEDLSPWEREAWSVNFFTTHYRTATWPLVTRFLQAGPTSPLVADDTDQGAEYALAMAVSIPALHGPGVLRQTLDRLQPIHTKIRSRDPADLRRAYERVLNAQGSHGYTIFPGGFIPTLSLFHRPPLPGSLLLPLAPGEAPCYWVYLPPGFWHLTLTVKGSGAFQMEARLDQQTLRPLFFRRSAQATSVSPFPGDGRWHRLRLATTTDEWVGLQSIRVWPARIHR